MTNETNETDYDYENAHVVAEYAYAYDYEGERYGVCSTRVLESENRWWVDDGDDDHRNIVGDYDDQESAECAAREWALKMDVEKKKGETK